MEPAAGVKDLETSRNIKKLDKHAQAAAHRREQRALTAAQALSKRSAWFLPKFVHPFARATA